MRERSCTKNKIRRAGVWLRIKKKYEERIFPKGLRFASFESAGSKKKKSKKDEKSKYEVLSETGLSARSSVTLESWCESDKS